ncbi:hypothetical protein RA279_28110, partial [Pseudomonas syringae pv. tagetis]|uniref:hypothetical protein n=1 Tax=Pseudomonas syringae group genomosp. 7 TaxID=251699 RepID=UPI00376FC923
FLRFLGSCVDLVGFDFWCGVRRCGFWVVSFGGGWGLFGGGFCWVCWCFLGLVWGLVWLCVGVVLMLFGVFEFASVAILIRVVYELFLV